MENGWIFQLKQFLILFLGKIFQVFPDQLPGRMEEVEVYESAKRWIIRLYFSLVYIFTAVVMFIIVGYTTFVFPQQINCIFRQTGKLCKKIWVQY